MRVPRRLVVSIAAVTAITTWPALANAERVCWPGVKVPPIEIPAVTIPAKEIPAKEIAIPTIPGGCVGDHCWTVPTIPTITIPAVTIPAGKSETYTITFRGATPGQATFEASLQSDCLGEKPLRAEKAVTVTSGR